MEQFPQKLKTSLRATRERLAKGRHKSFRLTSRQKNPLNVKAGAEEAWRLTIDSLKLIFRNKKIFLWLAAFYTIATYLLVGGVSQEDYLMLKEGSLEYASGVDAVTTAAAYFGAVVTGGLGTIPSELQQFLTGIITLLFWLVTLWSARMILAGKKIKLRDAFYSAPTPLISTLVVLAIIVLQLIPAAAGLLGFSTSLTEGWVTNFAVAIAYGAAALLLVLLSLYWLSSSVIALGVVALPGMYPIHAFRDARTLVMGRRWNIIMRIITVFILMALVWSFVLIPIFMLDNWLRFDWLPLVPIAVQVMAGISLVFVSVYAYKLYRSLL